MTDKTRTTLRGNYIIRILQLQGYPEGATRNLLNGAIRLAEVLECLESEGYPIPADLDPALDAYREVRAAFFKVSSGGRDAT